MPNNNNNDPITTPAPSTRQVVLTTNDTAGAWSYEILERSFRAPAPQPVYREYIQHADGEVEAVEESMDECAPVRERYTASGRAYTQWADFAVDAWAVPPAVRASRPARTAPTPAPVPTPVEQQWAVVYEKAMQPIRNYYGDRASLLCRVPNIPMWGQTNVVYQMALEGESEPLFACFKVTWRGNRVYEVTLALDPMLETNYMYHCRRNCGNAAIRQYHEAVRAARYKLIAKQYALNAKVYQQFLPTILDDIDLRYALAPREYVRANKQNVRRERAAIAEQEKIRKHLSSPNAIRPAGLPETDRGDRARSSRTRTQNRRNDEN